MVLFISGCRVRKQYHDTVELPEGTSLKTATEIMMIVWNDNFAEKITKKFPSFDPIRNPSRYGLYLNCVELGTAKKKGHTIFIRIEIKFAGSKPENAQEILEYGKTIVEKAVENYFSK